MTSRDFVFWLQGFFEVSGCKTLNNDQVDVIKNHLNMVFIHEIDPAMGNKDHQEDLQKAHDIKKSHLPHASKLLRC